MPPGEPGLGERRPGDEQWTSQAEHGTVKYD